MLLLVPFAVAADELQRRRTDHDRAVQLVEEVRTRVLDLQLRQLAVNGLDADPVYQELRSSKLNLGALAENEMAELSGVLGQAAPRAEIAQQSRRLARRIVVKLLAEQARIKKRRGADAAGVDEPAEETADRDALVEQVEDLEKLSESLDDLLDKQARAKDLAVQDADAARELEESIAEELQSADDESVLDDEIESRLDQAQDAVDKASQELQEDSAASAGDRMQAVEAAEDALMEASVEVESQLSDIRQSLEPGSASENQSTADGVSKNEPSSGTTRDLGAGTASTSDQEIATRSLADEAWFTRLPPAIQAAIRAKTRRPPPRGYEDRLREYFRHTD